MTCEIQASGAIDLFFYEELAPADRVRVEAHLRTCAACRLALDELRTIRAALASRPDAAAPSGGDWSAFMARLDASLHGSPGAGAGADGSPRPGRVLTMPARRQLVPYLAIAALVILVTSGVLLIVRDTATTAARPAVGAGSPDMASADSPVPAMTASDAQRSESAVRADPALAAVSDQHFERSKLVVLGLTTKDPAAAEADWAHERELATSLLSDTRLYRQAARERGMEPLAGVLEDLELVLLQTAMAEERDAASLERLQRLIRRRDLLTKMNVVQAGGR